MKKLGKISSVVLSMIVCICLVLGSVYTGVFAASAYNVLDLLENDNARIIGRTVQDNGLICDWPGTGFEMKVNANGGTFTVGLTSGANIFVDILVDGKLVTRTLTNSSVTSVSATLSAGEHTVKVLRDTQPATSGGFFKFNTVTFDGTVLDKPLDKDLYFEIVGDSYACGDGAADGVAYQPGVAWTTPQDYCIINSFGYTMANELNADVSFVTRGGIGLTMGDTQETGTSTVTIDKAYNYPTFYSRTTYGEADFSRKPNAVIVEIGANDGTGSAELATWKTKAATFKNQIREKYNDPNLPIVWMITGSKHQYYTYLRTLADSDANFFPWRYFQGGNGSAALKTQTAGHPSKTQQIEWGQKLAEFISSNKKIMGTEIAPAPDFVNPIDSLNPVNYYVKDADVPLPEELTGTTTYTSIMGAVDAANSAKVLTSNDKLVINIIGKYHLTTQTLEGGSSHYAKTSSGARVPTLFTTYNYDGTNMAEIDLVYNKTKNTGGDNMLVFYSDNSTFRNIKIYSPNLKDYYGTKVANSGACQVINAIKTRGYNVVFDNVVFGTAQSSYKQYVEADSRTNTGLISTRKQGSVTFVNGDYTTLNYVAAGSADTPGAIETNYSDREFTVNIEKDAKMPGLYAMRGTNVYKKCTININGGTVSSLSGTLAGTANARISVEGDIELNINGGKETGTIYALRAYADTKGDVTLTVNGGEVTGSFCGIGLNSTVASGKKLKLELNGGTLTGTLYGASGGGSDAHNVCTADIENVVNGGTINGNFVGIGNYTELTGNVTNTIKSGLINGTYYVGVGVSCKVSGTVTTNFSGGEIHTKPTADTQGVFFGGNNSSTVGNLINNISGGTVYCETPASTGICAIYFGGRSSFVVKDTLENNISGGAFLLGGVAPTSDGSGIFFSNYSGSVGHLKNNISAGLFDVNAAGSKCGSYQFSGRSLSNTFGDITNVIGKPNSDIGPTFVTKTVSLGGAWGRISANLSSTQPTAADCDSTVRLSNTIHFMNSTGPVSFATSGLYKRLESSQVKTDATFIKGSVENVINGGFFQSTVYLGGSNIYGHLKTTINGGYFMDVYGADSNQARSTSASYTDAQKDESLASVGIYDGAELIINDYKTFKAATSKSYALYAGYNEAKMRTPQTAGVPALKLEINGGTFDVPVYGGSASGDVDGDIVNEINGGTFKDVFYGGSASGTVNGHISNTLNNRTGTMGVFYGGNKAGTVGDGIENNASYWRTTGSKSGTAAKKNFYAGSYSGAVNLKADSTYQYAINTNIYSATGQKDKYGQGDICIDGDIYAANRIGDVGGDVYMILNGGNNIAGSGSLCNVGAGNEYKKGIIDGDITVEIGNGGYFGNQIYLGHQTASTESGSAPEVTGEINFNLIGGHIKKIVDPASDVTFGKTPNVTIDLQNASSIINDANTGNSDKYIMNLIGGPKSLTITTSARLYVDNAEITEEKPFTVSKYASWLTDKPQVVLPTNVDETAIFCKPQESCLNNFKAVRTDEHVYLVGITEETNSMGVVFELNEAITADVLVQKEGAASEIVNILGSCPWQYTFMGKTVKGAFDKTSEIKTVDSVDYYVVKINIPTGKFDETVAFTCQCGIDKTFVIDDAFQKGQEQQGDIGKEDMKQLFKDISDYGKEVSAAVYGKPIETPIDHGNTEEFIAKYDKGQTVGLHQHIVGTNLLLADKVSIQLYANFDNIADISAVKLDGVALGETGFTISPVTDPELSDIANYVISIPIIAEEMTKQHTIQILCGGVVTDEFTSSVGYYCAEYIRSAEESAVKFQGVSKALLKYIDQVSTCFPE